MMETNTENKRGSKIFLTIAMLCFVGTFVLVVVLIKNIAIVIPESPSMGSPNWFETSREISELEFAKAGAIAFSTFGIVATLIIGGVLLSLYYRAPQRAVQSGVNTLASTISTLREAIAPTPKPAEKEYCSYCGVQLGDGEKFCSACGGAKKKK